MLSRWIGLVCVVGVWFGEAQAAPPPHVVTSTTHAQRTPAFSHSQAQHRMIYHR